MKRAHFIHSRFLDPTNPIEVALIGAGGTGSQMLTCLSRMNHAFNELGHAGFNVTLIDDDVITNANLGRQLFAESELGMHKAAALINRVNRFFGSKWTARIQRLQDMDFEADIYISCVDSVQARKDLAELLKNAKESRHRRVIRSYWMDFGNSRYSGQVLLSTIGPKHQPKSELFETVEDLPFITDEFSEQLAEDLDDDTPSCSLAEALEKQDLFINSSLAQLGSSLLWNLFRNGMTTQRGFFLNLETFRSQAIPV